MKNSSKPMTQQQLNHRAAALNPNKGTSGQNTANAHVNGNRGAQMNPNNPAHSRSVGKASGNR
jgi:hypothetical protein